MPTDNRIKVAKLLWISREVAAQHLPIGQSFIPYDLLLQVYLNELSTDKAPLSIKSLFASLPYSDMGMRYHLRRLIEGEWVEITKNNDDPRMRNVIAGYKTHKSFALIVSQLTAILDR